MLGSTIGVPVTVVVAALATPGPVAIILEFIVGTTPEPGAGAKYGDE